MSTTFTMKRRVTFAETDLAGVLHFSNYFRLMEEVEHAFWRSLGLGVVQRDGDRTISWPRVAVACEYETPARFEDELELHLTMGKISERTVRFDVEFLREGQRIALGRATAVCCLMADAGFDPIAIPADIRDRLTAFRTPGPTASG